MKFLFECLKCRRFVYQNDVVLIWPQIFGFPFCLFFELSLSSLSLWVYQKSKQNHWNRAKNLLPLSLSRSLIYHLRLPPSTTGIIYASYRSAVDLPPLVTPAPNNREAKVWNFLVDIVVLTKELMLICLLLKKSASTVSLQLRIKVWKVLLLYLS